MAIGVAAGLALADAAHAGHEVAVPVIAMPPAYDGVGTAGAAPPAGLDRWWRLFGDPHLDALEDEALRNGPDARTAAARLLEARATRKAQVAQTLPSGSIAANASRQKQFDLGAAADDLNPTSGLTDTLNANFNVSWELDLFGRLAVARRVAAADAAQALFNIEGTRASLAAAIADAYFQALGLAAQLDDARASVRIQSSLLDAARRRADAGAGPADEVDRVAGVLSQAMAEVDDLEAQRLSVRRQLLILLGRGTAPDADLLLAADAPAVPAMPAAVPAELLSRRPDVREAEFRLRSQIGTARLRHLAVFPTLTLLPALGLSRTVAPGVSFIPPTTLVTSEQTTNQGFWTLAAGLNVPTLDIPKLLFQARAEDARTRETAIAYEHTGQTAFGEAQNALGELAAGRAAAAELKAGETRARLAYDGAKRRYDAGLDDLTSTLNAEQSWRSVRASLTLERTAALRHAVQAYKALGGGWAFGGAGN